MEKANQLYQNAIELLQQADERHGVENEAEQKLRMINNSEELLRIIRILNSS